MLNKNKIEIDGTSNTAVGRDYNDNRKYIFADTSPLRFFDEEIKEVIKEFAKVARKEIGRNYNFKRIAAEQKNELNGLTNDYFTDVILENSICYFQQIDDFLKSPINAEYLEMYENTVDDLNQKIAIFRKKYEEFEFVFNDLFDHIFYNNKSELKTDRRLIWVMLHYMYWKCDIGKGGEIGHVTSS
ncbi:ABC-three component system protein [Alkalibacillus aidingensis]|uniref:ABC-three component system protein n=1 Tax=Alkalibacillus aidingensis TaxID=2747607 RepID=UPI001660EF4F|nr:ABC-three component system protein [Alkalibacillus aidingensis]